MKPVRYLLRSRRGNALVLAILTTMLLFIIGMAFLSTTMTERATTVTVEQDAILDHGIEQVIDQINEALAGDLFHNGLLGRSAAYDYPDDSDPWLASLEPEFYDGTAPGAIYPSHYYWPHITDLWGRFLWKGI